MTPFAPVEVTSAHGLRRVRLPVIASGVDDTENWTIVHVAGALDDLKAEIYCAVPRKWGEGHAAISGRAVYQSAARLSFRKIDSVEGETVATLLSRAFALDETTVATAESCAFSCETFDNHYPDPENLAMRLVLPTHAGDTREVVELSIDFDLAAGLLEIAEISPHSGRAFIGEMSGGQIQSWRQIYGTELDIDFLTRPSFWAVENDDRTAYSRLFFDRDGRGWMELREPKQLRVEAKFEWAVPEVGVIELRFSQWSGFAKSNEFGEVQEPKSRNLRLTYAFQLPETSSPEAEHAKHRLHVDPSPFGEVTHELLIQPLTFIADQPTLPDDPSDPDD